MESTTRQCTTTLIPTIAYNRYGGQWERVRVKRRDRQRIYSRERYRNDPNYREKKKIYKRKYENFRYHRNDVIKSVLNEDELIDLDDLAERIQRFSGFSIRQSTLIRLCKTAEDNIEEKPLTQAGEGLYRLNEEFYKRSAVRKRG